MQWYPAVVYLLILVVASGTLSPLLFASETPDDQIPAGLVPTTVSFVPELADHGSFVEGTANARANGACPLFLRNHSLLI